MAAERAGEDICTFARTFGRRKVDTCVIRAVYEELERHVQFGEGRCPIRETDRLAGDLHVDDEEIAEIVQTLARRTRRSETVMEQLLVDRRPATVGDLVYMINSEPGIDA